MKKLIAFIFVCVFLLSSISWAQISQFRKVNDKGIANMVFASIAIEKGKESKIELRTEFTGREQVFTRCYFPKTFGNYNPRSDEDFVVDLYLDGKFVQRKTMAHPESEWDQIQVYLLNTGDDDFSSLETALLNADSGNHTLKLSVGLERYMGTKDVLDDNGLVKKEKVFKMEYLSEGEITLTTE